MTEPKLIYIDLSKDVDNNLKHETDFIREHNNFLAEHIIKNKISPLLLKYKHENNIYEHKKQ